jgi:dienelactone hydrolase
MRRCLIVLALLSVLTPSARAEIRTTPIEYRDGPVVLEGYLAFDDATQNTRPGVLVAPEWWGLTDYPKHRAEMLARMGYVAFVIDMYGKGKTTSDPHQAGEWATPFHKDRGLMRQRAKAGLDVLLAQKYVDTNRIGAIGYCFGGSVVLELARAGTPLAGVIAFHGDLSRTDNEGPDDIKAKVLICQGADDPLAPVTALPAFQQEMTDAKADYQINIYSGAVHAFTNPNADLFHIPGIGYNKSADQRSWMALCDFFEELFEPRLIARQP